MLADALQHIKEVLVWIDVVEAKRHQKALHDGDVVRAHLGLAIELRLVAQRDGAQSTLKMIRLDLHVRVVQVNLQPVGAFARIAQRRGQRALADRIAATWSDARDP